MVYFTFVHNLNYPEQSLLMKSNGDSNISQGTQKLALAWRRKNLSSSAWGWVGAVLDSVILTPLKFEIWGLSLNQNPGLRI